MGRYSPNPSKHHWIEQFSSDDFRLHWTCDRYYAGVRHRFPRGNNRDTDRAGALRFSKKWGVPMPEEKS